MPEMSPPLKNQKQTLQSLFLGGLLPIAIYTILEEKAGPLWGLCFGMGFGLLEVIYEWIKYRKVETITWVGNSLLMGMGGISLVTQEGIWFKLQPAILEFGMAALLIGSNLFRKPFLVLMAEKQKTFDQMPEQIATIMRTQFGGMNLRLGFFFLIHGFLAVYAALFWSTRAWALLKGVGLTLSVLLYLFIEIFFLRRKMHVR